MTSTYVKCLLFNARETGSISESTWASLNTFDVLDRVAELLADPPLQPQSASVSLLSIVVGVRSKSAALVADGIKQFCACMKSYEESPYFSFLTVDGKLSLPFTSFGDGLIVPTPEQLTVDDELHVHESIVASCASLIGETVRLEKRGILTNPKLLVIVEGYTEGCYSSVAAQVALWAADVADGGGDIFGVDLGERSWREDDPLEPLLGPIKRFWRPAAGVDINVLFQSACQKLRTSRKRYAEGVKESWPP